MTQIRAAILIAAADLRRRLRNRSFVIQALAGPIVLAGIISLAFGGGDFETTIGLVDADGSPASEGFVTGVAGADAGGIDFVEVDSAADARARVDDGDLGAAVVVPDGFTASLQTDAPGDLDIITSSDGSVSAEVARSVARGFTDQANAARLAAATIAATGGTVPDADQLGAIELPVQVTTVGTGGDVSPAAYFGPAMGLLFLFLSVGAVARDLLGEKRIGLLDRVRAGPVSDGAILAGKGASVIAIGVTSLGVIWAVTELGLGARWGDPVGVVAMILAAAVAVGGVAGLVAGLARTEQSADMLASVVAFVFALVGGAFIPIGDMPDALARLSLLTPTGWALRGFAELSAGNGSVADVIPHVLVLLAWGLVAGGIAARVLPRRLGAT